MRLPREVKLRLVPRPFALPPPLKRWQLNRTADDIGGLRWDHTRMLSEFMVEGIRPDPVGR